MVELLKSFMNRTVVPALPDNHHSLNEWKFLNGIISSNPVDCAQLDFYLHMVNKNSTPQVTSQLVLSRSQGYADKSNSLKPSSMISENNNKKSGFGIANNRYSFHNQAKT